MASLVLKMEGCNLPGPLGCLFLAFLHSCFGGMGCFPLKEDDKHRVRGALSPNARTPDLFASAGVGSKFLGRGALTW